MNIQWYPGHMTKTRRMMQANIGLVDVVIELLDARIPYSSKNPDMDELAQAKPRLVLLNKADLADPNVTRQWEAYYLARGIKVMAISATEKKIAGRLAEKVRGMMVDKIAKEKKRGRLTVNIRAMVVGIPNVGKSTLINQLAGAAGRGGAPTSTGDKPGVTRGKQWIKVAKDFDLLDTPGVLWPKFEDKEVGERLAFTGAINDVILDAITLSEAFIGWIMEEKPEALISRYKLEQLMEAEQELLPRDILEAIGVARGFKIKGGEVDLERAAITLLDEYRGGRLGRITLERP
ncbi:MAG: ribosome biogenesis GTPase YlqF [Defluviitaleaceae bacterium]|nr:ribosome biogenesis GTPase YlqF [Defluviitaleaceae bacterium]